MTRDDAVSFISQFPIYQYAFIRPEDDLFSAGVVKECRKCANYRTSWSCPPAIVGFEKCRRILMSYDDIFVFSNLYETRDDCAGEKKRLAVKEHERITDLAAESFKSSGFDVYILTSDKCRICDRCTFPKKACAHQNRMHPCIESHGVRMSDLLAKCEMDCYFEENYALLFSLIFYREAEPRTGDR